MRRRRPGSEQINCRRRHGGDSCFKARLQDGEELAGVKRWQGLAAALMLFETIGINGAEPEDADWELVLSAPEKAKILRAHDRFCAYRAVFAKPALEKHRQLLR